jgi:hypothetical protein
VAGETELIAAEFEGGVGTGVVGTTISPLPLDLPRDPTRDPGPLDLPIRTAATLEGDVTVSPVSVCGGRVGAGTEGRAR